MNPFNENSEDELRFDNELKRLKLKTEYGMDFSKSPDSKDLHPKIENDFLSYVDQFEKAWHTSKEVTVSEFLGKPIFRKEETIPDEELEAELEKVMEILAKKKIVVDSICGVDERVFYRFITDELMLAEITDMYIPGMNTHYIYEEFHPNHEYDIRKHCQDFFRFFLNKEKNYYETWLTKKAENSPEVVSFRAGFESFRQVYFEIISISIAKEEAFVLFKADFHGRMEGTREELRFNGEGAFQMKFQHECWCVDEVKWPDPIAIG